MKIGIKLAFWFLIVSLLVNIVGYIGLKGIKNIGDSFEQASEDAIPVVSDMIHLEYSSIDIRLETLDYLITGEVQHLDKLQEIFKDFTFHKDDIIKREWSEGGKWTILIDKLESFEKKSKELSNELIALKDQGELVESLQLGQTEQLQEMELLEQDLFLILEERLVYENEELKEQREAVKIRIGSARRNIIIFSILIVLLGFGIGLYFSRIISIPIKKLREGAEIISEGNLDYKTNIRTKDEIGQLSGAFDQMTSELKKSKDELNKYASGLEEQVVKRTKQLQSKIDELEKFQKVTIGRELKMIELKKKIKELESKK